MSRLAPRRVAALLVLIALIVAAAAALAQLRLPALSGRVVDQANVLSAATRSELTALFETHERETSNQIVVATVPSLQGTDIADFGVQLGRAWKLGQGDRSNGVLLLVAPNERQVRIEVGYGLEGALPDALAFRIIEDEILPRFRANDVNGGVVAGARAIIGAITGTFRARPANPAVTWIERVLQQNPDLVIFLLFLVIGACAHLYDRYRRWRLGPKYLPPGPSRQQDRGGFGFGGASGGRSSDRGGWSPGFRGGGGSFGGGGASGRW